jgi:polyhydroxybutyrate depolymerase
MLSGVGSTAQMAAEDFGWQAEADRNGFITIFVGPLPEHPDEPASKQNFTFWENGALISHIPAGGRTQVDDEGYLLAVLHDVIERDLANRHRVFFAGFSSGSAMVQRLAADHPKDITGIVAVATPLLYPPSNLARPVPLLYIRGSDDFSGYYGLGPHNPHFATTPHGNWVTWGFLNGCRRQTGQSDSPNRSPEIQSLRLPNGCQ